MKHSCKQALLMAVIFSLSFLSGCGDKGPGPEPIPPTPTVTIEPGSITLPEEGGTVTAQLTATGEWTLSVPSNLWFSITPASGTGNTTLSISTRPSSYREIRESSVRINPAVGTGANFEVTQSLENTAPLKSEAITPANGATDVSLYPIFSWTNSEDPDGDWVNYYVMFSTDRFRLEAPLLNGPGALLYQGSKSAFNMVAYIPYAVPNNPLGEKLLPNTKYYWRITTVDMLDATTLSEIFSFTTGNNAAGSWGDGESRVYQDNTIGSATAFTLVVTGDGFTAEDMADGGNWDKASAEAIEALFSVEPYKTYSSYLNVIRIGAISAEQGASLKPNGTETPCTVIKNTKFGTIVDTERSAWCGLYGETYPGQPGKTLDDVHNFVRDHVPAYAADESKMNNVSILVIINHSSYNGLVNYYSDANTTMGFITRSNRGGGQSVKNVMVHEIGGHGVGHLADEYISSSGVLTEARKAQTIEFQSRGFYANVDVSGTRESCPWNHFFTSPEYKAYYGSVDYIEGARSVAKGIWRAEQSSCMVDNQLYFNGPSRESIVKRLKECAGETHTWAAFVAKDYARSANIGTRMLPDPNFVPLPEPVIWEK